MCDRIWKRTFKDSVSYSQIVCPDFIYRILSSGVTFYRKPSQSILLPLGIHSQPPSPVSIDHNTGKAVCCVVGSQPWLYLKIRILLKLSMPRSDSPENPIKLIRGRALVGASQVALIQGDTRSLLRSGRSPGGEGMATHCSILAWSVLWTVEPGGLQSIGLRRVGPY